MDSAASQRKSVVRPTNHDLARSGRWRNGKERVYGPRRKCAVNGLRKMETKGSWYRAGRTNIRMRPKTVQARGIVAVMETVETKNATIT